ncbi:hypothetical protein [Piscinibacter defluvii]|uniref:hypothetical protein n=1 Tax=Piscinibacter defluvii TaxID=1796922 RepID=UPI000FDEBB0C|nr:hypothetical protein [Piscinibacter defluvii]
MRLVRTPLRLLRRLPLVALLGLGAGVATAAPKTVCTVTINSSDEKESFQRHLPAGDYRFVELVQRGQPDWLASARQRGVSCDVLVISGHFDDGSEFYTDRPDFREFLTVHEMEHESCRPDGLFAHLKEVYLFGCNTLKSEPRYAASGEVLRSLQRAGASRAEAERRAAWLSERYGQSNRERLRHVFKDVPVLYGFSSKAPLGRYAGPLMERYFETAPAGEVGSGRPSATLLKLFGPSSMISVAGLTEADPHAGFRAEMCSLADDRPEAQKLEFLHRLLQREASDARMLLEHVERYLAGLGPARRTQPEVAEGLARIAADQPARERFLALARDADRASTTTRMTAVARSLGWLTPAQEQDEFVAMIARRMARNELGRHEVDLVCDTPAGRGAGLAERLQATGAPRAEVVADAAVLACLGSPAAHERTLRALTSPREDEVEIAQVYLRHRPMTRVEELRSVAAGIARMNTPAAQLRALEALAKQRLADAQSLREIAQLFPKARSLEAQRAIANILVRADYRQLAGTDLLRSLRQHRLRSPDGSDVIDLLIRLLQTA